MVGSATTFACYDGKRVAVLVDGGETQKVVRGIAQYGHDRRLGPVLWIRLENAEPGMYDLLLVEAEWNGAILPDTKYGCECCFMPRPFWRRG